MIDLTHVFKHLEDDFRVAWSTIFVSWYWLILKVWSSENTNIITIRVFDNDSGFDQCEGNVSYGENILNAQGIIIVSLGFDSTLQLALFADGWRNFIQDFYLIWLWNVPTVVEFYLHNETFSSVTVSH